MQDAFGAEITRLIDQWRTGDQQAERLLFETLYRRLHDIAARCLKDEAFCQSLSPTELLHEAYVRLESSKKMAVKDRSHFLALVARVMRNILVDRARLRRSEKRGAGGKRVDLLDGMLVSEDSIDEIIAVDSAMQRLNAESSRRARVVELCYFGGFTIDEAAAALGISGRTAKREWQVARVFLKNAMSASGAI